MGRALFLAVAVIASQTSPGAPLQGPATVIDGDTLELWGLSRRALAGAPGAVRPVVRGTGPVAGGTPS